MRLALVCALVALAGAVMGWFDSSDERASSEARKCQKSMAIQMTSDANSYCANALEILKRESALKSVTVARVQMQVAALALIERSQTRAETHCKLAVAAWKNVVEPDVEAEKLESIKLCGRVSSDSM